MLATHGFGTRGRIATYGYGADARPLAGEVVNPERRATAMDTRSVGALGQREAEGLGSRSARAEVTRG